ncbi:MAG: HAMP domain-containing protein, partial [Acidobacteriaceae bacterium]|nr:HAMP domain-containing protein [Acidobacteriaceae bacterium]
MADVRDGFANLFRPGDLTIGVRLTACFLTIVILMIAADTVAVWQLHRLAAYTDMLNTADKASSAIVQLHLDVNSFSSRVVVLTRSHNAREFSSEADSLRETFLRHVREAEQVLGSSPELAQDPLISTTLETLKTTLPSQIDSEIELASAGDWPALQLRLMGQIQDLIDVSSSLVQVVEERVFQQRARVEEKTRQLRNRLFIVIPAAWFVTLIAAAALGWYITRTITVPLSKLTASAQALARGDFRHEVEIRGNDELTVLGNAFNNAARQLRHQFEMTADLAHVNRVSTLGELMASISHELRQPIAAAVTSASSCLQWLAHDPPNVDKARATATRIEKDGNRAASIIDRLRALYKKAPPKRELLAVNDVMAEMAGLLRGEATRNAVSIRAEIASEIPAVMADRVQI